MSNSSACARRSSRQWRDIFALLSMKVLKVFKVKNKLHVCPRQTSRSQIIADVRAETLRLWQEVLKFMQLSALGWRRKNLLHVMLQNTVFISHTVLSSTTWSLRHWECLSGKECSRSSSARKILILHCGLLMVGTNHNLNLNQPGQHITPTRAWAEPAGVAINLSANTCSRTGSNHQRGGTCTSQKIHTQLYTFRWFYSADLNQSFRLMTLENAAAVGGGRASERL